MKYRKKPVVVEAMQFDGSEESAKNINKWTKDQIGERAILSCMRKGTWVIKYKNGNCDSVSQEIFAKTYEAVEE